MYPSIARCVQGEDERVLVDNDPRIDIPARHVRDTLAGATSSIEARGRFDADETAACGIDQATSPGDWSDLLSGICTFPLKVTRAIGLVRS